jgi:hypothetical protein
MGVAIDLARRCLTRLASDEEREDRLGDLEEIRRLAERQAGAAAAERLYLREAAAICLSILRRAITKGGMDMTRIFLWAAISVAGILLFLHLGGGAVFVYLQPFEWGVILAAMLGFAAAGRRLGAWPGILVDLRRADRLRDRNRPERRAAYLREAGERPTSSVDFAHLEGILRIARHAAPAEEDRLMSGGIALFREKSRQRIAVVEQTTRDAYAGAAIALIFGVIHMLENLEAPIPVLGHLLGGALCAGFFGVILGRAVLAPIAGRLSALYEQQGREMDALRLSLAGGEACPFPADAFDVLASGLTVQA